MAEEMKIPRRVMGLILSSVGAGVVPRVGASYIAIGRNDEVATLVKDLEFAADGGGSMKFVIGKYGSGKSFLLNLARGYALEHGFITADCDLSPERKLCNVETYRELMKNIASKASPEGGALPGIISKWLTGISLSLASEGYDPKGDGFSELVCREVYKTCREFEGYVGGFDFALVLSEYYKAVSSGDDEKKSNCLRWLRGEYTTRTAAKGALRVGDIIEDTNWYDYIKLWTAFFKKIGYNGFLVIFDEGVNLYKIHNRISREKNYEKLLSMFNDSLGGRAPGLALVFAGTPEFLEDTRRGVFSYEALRSRLHDTRYKGGDYINLMGPIIRLRRLSDNQLFALIKRLTALHSQYHGYEPSITDEDMTLFLTVCLNKIGSDSLVTPREIAREYLMLLDILLQNKSVAFKDLIKDDRINLKSYDDTDGDSEGFEEFDDF